MADDDKVINLNKDKKEGEQGPAQAGVKMTDACPFFSTTMLVPTASRIARQPELAVQTFFVRCQREVCFHYNKDTKGCKLWK